MIKLLRRGILVDLGVDGKSLVNRIEILYKDPTYFQGIRRWMLDLHTYSGDKCLSPALINFKQLVYWLGSIDELL